VFSRQASQSRTAGAMIRLDGIWLRLPYLGLYRAAGALLEKLSACARKHLARSFTSARHRFTLVTGRRLSASLSRPGPRRQQIPSHGQRGGAPWKPSTLRHDVPSVVVTLASSSTKPGSDAPTALIPTCTAVARTAGSAGMSRHRPCRWLQAESLRDVGPGPRCRPKHHDRACGEDHCPGGHGGSADVDRRPSRRDLPRDRAGEPGGRHRP
jgi:hypothetical protein